MENSEKFEMMENITAAENPVQPEKAEEKYVFSLGESIYAWLCIAAGFSFCKVGTAASHPLGALIFLLAIFGGTSLALWRNGFKPNKASILIGASAVASAFSVVMTSNAFVQFIAWIYCLAAYCLFVYTATENSLSGGLSNYIGADLVRAVAVLPLSCLSYIFEAAFAGKRGRGTNAAGKIIAGLLMAVVPSAVVLFLLSYDNDFMNIIRNVFEFSFDNIFSNVLCLIFGVPVAMYLFGMFMAGRQHACAEVLNTEKWNKTAQSIRILPVATAVASVLPILSLYVIFFISQWKYYISGFAGVLPDEYSYTNYAREGFFQLCAVACINFVIIALVSLAIRRSSRAGGIALKVLSIVFAAFTLVLISTAIAKMVMYINFYGLTHKRVYASWFMLLLAILCGLIIAKQFSKKLKLILVSAAVCVAMFLGLAVSNVDSFIAKYNVDRYLDGSLHSVDVSAMLDLGDSAVPHMVRLAEEMNHNNIDPSLEFLVGNTVVPDLYTRCRAYLFYMDVNMDEGVFKATLPGIRARAALDKTGIEWEDLTFEQQEKVYLFLGRGGAFSWDY